MLRVRPFPSIPSQVRASGIASRSCGGVSEADHASHGDEYGHVTPEWML
jgi:hypothetical protein